MLALLHNYTLPCYFTPLSSSSSYPSSIGYLSALTFALALKHQFIIIQPTVRWSIVIKQHPVCWLNRTRVVVHLSIINLAICTGVVTTVVIPALKTILCASCNNWLIITHSTLVPTNNCETTMLIDELDYIKHSI